jgi:hypothetical protein
MATTDAAGARVQLIPSTSFDRQEKHLPPLWRVEGEPTSAYWSEPGTIYWENDSPGDFSLICESLVPAGTYFVHLKVKTDGNGPKVSGMVNGQPLKGGSTRPGTAVLTGKVTTSGGSSKVMLRVKCQGDGKIWGFLSEATLTRK